LSPGQEFVIFCVLQGVRGWREKERETVQDPGAFSFLCLFVYYLFTQVPRIVNLLLPPPPPPLLLPPSATTLEDES
jgi:hypothetical protein